MRRRSNPDPSKPEDKKRYEPPALIRYGDLKEATKGGAPSGEMDNPDPWIGTFYS